MIYPKCPANYFGKGEDFDLPDDPEFLKEFEAKFIEWTTSNPDDPTGEKALALWKQLQAQPKPAKLLAPPKNPSPTLERALKPTPPPIPEKLEETTDFTLQLPPSYIQKIREYATHKKRRPRDIIKFWIDNYAIINESPSP